MCEKNNNIMETDDLAVMIPPIATAARTGDYAGTARLHNRFLRVLQKQISRGVIGPEGISKITYSLETLLAMQKMEDWVAFADILEYEFLPLWQKYGLVSKKTVQ